MLLTENWQVVMSNADLLALIGIGVSVVVAMAGIAITSFRSMTGRLDRAVEQILGRLDRDVEKLEKAIKEGDDALHERVNRLRDDVSKNYVRRDDLDGHLTRIGEQLKELRDDLKQVIRQLANRSRSRQPSG